MKILVDTHIYLWMLSDPDRLGRSRRYELESPLNQVFLSAMSIAELMIKQAIGKIEIHFDPIEMAHKTGLEILDFTGADALMLGSLPFHHRDPFDRMLIVQSLTNGLTLMSDDVKMSRYECKLM